MRVREFLQLWRGNFEIIDQDNNIIYDDAVIGSNWCYPKPSYLSKYIAFVEITNQSLADKYPHYIINLGDNA